MLCLQKPRILQDLYDNDRWKKGDRFWYYLCNNFLKITDPISCICLWIVDFEKRTRRLTYLTLVGRCLFCASLSLSTVRPQSRNAWWCSPGAWSDLHTDISPFQISVMTGLTLVVLIMIARHPSATTIRKLWKNKGLFHIGPGNYTAHLGPHGGRWRGMEREKQREGEKESAGK